MSRKRGRNEPSPDSSGDEASPHAGPRPAAPVLTRSASTLTPRGPLFRTRRTHGSASSSLASPLASPSALPHPDPSAFAAVPPPPPRTVTLAQAQSSSPGFNPVGGGQSATLYRHDPEHPHTRGKDVVLRSDQASIPRPPRSYEADRLAQTKRHLATVADTFLRPKPHLRGPHQEVQVAHREEDPDALVLSTNTPAGNERLRDRLDALRTHIAGAPTSGSSARQQRHHLKARGELSPDAMRKISVLPKADEGGNDGLHAERRLVAAGYREPHGTMRPCATCFGNLDTTAEDDRTRTGPGKTWVSSSANAAGGGDHVSNFRTRVTVGHDGKFHHDHGSESDSDAPSPRVAYPRSYGARRGEAGPAAARRSSSLSSSSSSSSGSESENSSAKRPRRR